MKSEFKMLVADNVETDEIWVELRLEGKLAMEIKPRGDSRVVSLCCEGSWIDTDLDSFSEALEACIKRANQIAAPLTEEQGDR